MSVLNFTGKTTISVNAKFAITDTVYLFTDQYQNARIITAIVITPDCLIYECICGTETSKHYDFELTNQRNTSKIGYNSNNNYADKATEGIS